VKEIAHTTKIYQKNAAMLQSIKAFSEICLLRRPWRFSDQIKNSNGIVTLAVPTDQPWVSGVIVAQVQGMMILINEAVELYLRVNE
jgi:hypothetical protein